MGSTAEAPPAAPAPVQEVKVGSPETEEKVRVTLSSTPASARVTLDGVVVALPFSGELARDGSLHDVRATAPGFLPFRQLVGFDRDRQLDIVLQRAPKRQPVASGPQSKNGTRPGIPTLSLGIDTTDPYTKKKVN